MYTTAAEGVVYISTQVCESSTNGEIFVNSSNMAKIVFYNGNTALITCYKEMDYRSAVRNRNTDLCMCSHAGTYALLTFIGTKHEL